MNNLNPESSNARDQDTRWTETDGIQVDELAEHDLLSIRTTNNEYEIVVISPQTAQVMVRGGHYFPNHTLAYLSGSISNPHGISVGHPIEFFIDGKRIKTSTVRNIRVLRDSELAA